MKKKWIDGKTIVITGASSGIGRALARLFLVRHNAKIIGVGRNEQKMQEFKSSLGEYADNFEYRLFDVGQEKNWQDFSDSFADRQIDILINNAGILPSFANFKKYVENSASDSSYDSDHVMQTNFMSVVYGVKYLTPILEQSDTPAIINVASSAGLCALPGIAMYSASKGAVKNFTESIMLERDYYVGLVCPGFTKTEIFRSQKYSTESKLINMISTDLDKMSKKIYKGILKKKKRMVFGIDAKTMDKLYRHFPKSSLKLFNKILKKANIELFYDVFENKNKEKMNNEINM